MYKIYANYTKPLSAIPSYAYLAIRRAEKEKQLRVSLGFSQTFLTQTIESLFIPKDANSSVNYLKAAIDDGVERLLLPSLEREFFSDKDHRADLAAIKVFGDNLKHLLLTPPIKGHTILGFDPAFRT